MSVYQNSWNVGGRCLGPYGRNYDPAPKPKYRRLPDLTDRQIEELRAKHGGRLQGDSPRPSCKADWQPVYSRQSGVIQLWTLPR